MNLYALAAWSWASLLPFFYALIGFGLLITVHECGHFIFCKLFGIHTPTFSIGMGPTLFQRKIGDTNFRLALIPIGGYCEVSGADEVGQGEQANAQDLGPRSFRSKPYWQRFFVMTGGVLFNLLFAYIAFSALFFIGMPVQKEVSLVVKKVSVKADGERSRLMIGDKILRVGKEDLASSPKILFPALRKISEEIASKQPDELKVKVFRSGEEVSLSIPSRINGKGLSRGALAGASLELQVDRVEYEKYPLFSAVKMGIQKTHNWVGLFWNNLKMLVTKRNIKDFGGPIMIISQSFKFAKRGLLQLLVFLAIISINLAIINLLPIGALDGGQLLFETIEAVIRRRIPDVIRATINIASWVLIIGLILYLSYQDILALVIG